MFAVGAPDYQPAAPHVMPAVAQLPMEMVGEYAELSILPMNGSPRCATSALHFDSSLELLWVGDQRGHITSFYRPTMQKYTSFQVAPHTNSVVELLTFDDKVLSLTKNNLCCSLKRGIPVFNFTHDELLDSQCMSVRKDNRVLIGGKNPCLIELDLRTQAVINNVPVTEEEGTAIFRTTSKYLCCGGFNGKVMLRDHDSLKIQHTLDAHSGTLSDFDANGHLLITCGFSRRSESSAQHLSLDPFVKVYDLRMMRAMTPMQSIVQPSFLRFLSTYTRRMMIVSQSGQFLLVEDNAAITANTPFYQVNLPGSTVMNIDVSRSMQAIGFADSGGYAHIWSASNNPTYNQYPKEPEFADMQDQLDRISIDDETVPLSIVPMPYCQEPLLSDWPTKQCIPVSRRPPPIDPELLRSMKVVHGIGYAPNPGNRKRNQVPYKLKDIAKQDTRGKKAAVPDSPLGRDEQPHLYMVPKKYRKVVFKYSKLGDEENEMIQHYNKTNFAGLDPNVPNAYCNCMLQVLYFIEPLRCGLESHHNLTKEFDLAEELGFLFFMLDSATSGVILNPGNTLSQLITKGIVANIKFGLRGSKTFSLASNFLRAFRTIPEATALGLLQNSNKPDQMNTSAANRNLGQLIQNWNRFILQQLHGETMPSPPDDNSNTLLASEESTASAKDASVETKSLLERLCGTEVRTVEQVRTGQSTERYTKQYLFNLTYPSVGKPGEPQREFPFTTIIKNSISSQLHTKSWNEATENYQPIILTKSPRTLPDVLSLNCSLIREEDFQFWKEQTKLFREKMERRLSQSKDPRKASSNGANAATSEAPKAAPSASDAWNVFAEREGLDLSFDRKAAPSWVPLEFKMAIAADGQLIVLSEDDDEQATGSTEATENLTFVEYELHSSVAHIDDARTGGNLVAHINVGKRYHQRKEGVTHTQWYLFNDFQISAIDKEESVEFDLAWKVPCILYYTRKDICRRYSLKINFPLTSDILLPTESISKGRRRLSSGLEPQSPSATMTFTPLFHHELPPRREMLIALDAEFVTLNPEEAELHSDGTRSTIKPSHLSAARITVVRGEGENEGMPFIDDYIATQEQVADYVTKFSGIKPGDLDVSISSKHLSTLKRTYCKLRYLIQTGCIIVGHGLSKDFKVINIFVPDDQIRDTVHLYHFPRKRYISLRFLAWYFLGEKIQNDMHDSIEDARTALKLYKKYLEMTDDGNDPSEFRQKTLKQLYDEGRKLEWKVPEDKPSPAATSPAT